MEVKLAKNSSMLRDFGYELLEEADIYDRQLQECYHNPRLYLDSCEYWVDYKVTWKTYKGNTPTVPYRYTQKGKELNWF